MYERVNPSHPDKIADRIAGALVDMAYSKQENPRIAVEVLIGHFVCHIVAETSVMLGRDEVEAVVNRIAGDGIAVEYREVPQDIRLAENQSGGIRCGDNGIFKGTPVTEEQRFLADWARRIYRAYPYDGKYFIDQTHKDRRFVVCQSNAGSEDLKEFCPPATDINPLGDWTGGINVDTGATNRKLGSDMGDSITGGGIHGKDLSKADVSVNIYAWLKAQETGQTVTMSCAIGDEYVNGVPYSEIVETARRFIESKGGFEKLAEWGLI